jgi:chitinase
MSQSIAQRVVGSAFVLAATLAFGARAEALSSTVVNKGNGLCVSALGGATANGTAVDQYTCDGSSNQSWTFTAVGSGYYSIASGKAAGQVWDVTGGTGATANGALIELWGPYAGDTNDQWQPVSEGGGYYHLVAKNSGKCLDVPGSSTALKQQLQQWTCNGGANQSFQVAGLGGGATATATKSPTATPTKSPTSATATKTATATATATTVSGAGNFPARFAAPYVETWNDNNLVTLSNNSGHKFWTLAFVISNGSCTPTWNGDTSLTGNSYGTYINNLRSQLGGDVIVSHGGASGTELGQACTSVSSLQAAYQKVIDQFKLTWIDLDIESGAESDTTSVDRRNKALKALQAANPSLRVSYTLAVDRTGLPSADLNLLKNAKTNGTRVDVVNIMAMDYGPCYSDMGQAGVDAANATKNQLASAGISASVGITPMIGTNDVSCEKFSTTDATVVANYAQANSYVRLLAFWAIGADNGYAYTHVFHPFH